MTNHQVIIGVAAGMGIAFFLVVLTFIVRLCCWWQRKKMSESEAKKSQDNAGYRSVSQVDLTIPSPQEPWPVAAVQPKPSALPGPLVHNTRSNSIGARSMISHVSSGSVATATDVDNVSIHSLISTKTDGSIDSPSYDQNIGTIQPELYQKKNVVLRHQSSSEIKLGSLHLRLRYDFKTSDLVIHVIEAQDLPSMDMLGGFSDPYIKVDLLPPIDSKVRKSAIKRNTLNPLFDEVFKFPITFDELKERQGVFSVYDYDKFSRNDVIGQVRVDFRSVDVSSSVELWSDIQSFRETRNDWGQLLLSLNYLPAAERLTVVIMKATKLKSTSPTSTLDPYVKVSVMADGKLQKKKKTTTQKSTCEPVWNEAMVFHVSATMLDKISLEITLIDHDTSGQRHIIGHVIMNKDRHGKEGSHWKEALIYSRKTIALWHNLHK